MIPEMLHPVRAGRFTRPATMKLALALAAMAAFAAPQAQADPFDSGGYTSSSTPEARARETKLQQEREMREGILGPTAAGGPIPELQVFAAVSLAETFSSNSAGTVGNNKSDFYTQPGIHLGALEQSQRLTASINYSLSGQYHARDHHLDQLVNRLNAMANAEVISQTLFLDLQANAQPQSLTRAGSLTAADGTPTNGNYRDTYSYAARPTLIHQFGSAVETDLWFSQSGVFFVTPSGSNTIPLPGFYLPPTNSRTSAIGARISSLDDFVRLKWSLNGTASDTYQSSHNSQKARSALANASYSVTDDFSIIATGGYQIYHSSYVLTKNLDGPTLLGGFQYIPSPNFSAYIQAGTKNNFPTYIGALTWDLSPITKITARADDRVQTPQQSLLGDLQNQGGSIGAPGGIDTSPGGINTSPGGLTGGGELSNGLSVDNSIYRYRKFDATVTRTTERMSYALSAFATLRQRLNQVLVGPADTHDKTFGLRATVSRDFRRDLRGTLGLSASKANEFGGNDRILQGDFDLNYTASQTLSFYFNTNVLNRDSRALVGFSNGSLTDVRVTVGVRKSF